MSTINTNVTALVAARVYNQNSSRMNQVLQRLSTGLRINRGADDPAGLIASETLRAEKSAISAAIENAGRADNVMSVAEGALQEVSSLLIALEGLVDHTANESGMSDQEVAANQLQVDAILDSINRIATTTTYGGKKLLDGSMDYTTSGVSSANIGQVTVNSARLAENAYRTVTVNVTTSAQTAQLQHTEATGALTSNVSLSIGGNKGVDTFTFAAGTTLSAIANAVNQSTDLTGVAATVTTASGGAATISFNSVKYGSSQYVSVEAINGTSFEVTGGTTSTRDTGVDAVMTINGQTASTDGLKGSIRTASLDIDITLTEAYGGGRTNSPTTFYVTGGGMTFQISPDLSPSGMVALGLKSMATTSLGDSITGWLSSLASGGTNQLSSKNFSTAQEIVRLASTQVAQLRGRIGAMQQNTIASTINSLQVAYENMSAAESVIRDADFAKETSELTRAQILVQSSTQVLSLANAAPQNVLALLR